MKRLLSIALFSAFVLSGHSQIVGWRVDRYIVERKIDTFLVYSFTCSGGISLDSCQNEESHYLMWKRNDSFYLKRFDYCKIFKAVSLDTTNPLTFYLKNRKVIDKEEIKQPTYYEVKRRRNTIDTLITTSTIDHSCYHTFRLPFTKNPKAKYADVYDLDLKTFDNGRKNIYYAYNQRTKFKALIDQTTFLINELKTKDKFVLE